MKDSSNETPSQTPDESSLNLRRRAAGWTQAHNDAVQSRLCALQAAGSEQALRRTAAHDLVTLEELEEVEIAVVRQLGLLAQGGSHRHAPVLARVLSDLSRIRTETAERATKLLKAAEELEARRELAAAEKATVRHLRSVG